MGTNPNGKVFVKSFDTDEDTPGADHKLRWLNFNKKINLITGGPLLPKETREVLIVAADNCVIGFGSLGSADAFDNRELFYKEILDGVTCIRTGYFKSRDEPCRLFVGSNCAIQGFNEEGEEM